MELAEVKKWLDEYLSNSIRMYPSLQCYYCSHESKDFLLVVASLLEKVGVKSRLEFNLHGLRNAKYFLIIDYYWCKNLDFVDTVRSSGIKYELCTQFT